jgi:pimeloyl-ACP methyl ester carboxylesterase
MTLFVAKQRLSCVFLHVLYLKIVFKLDTYDRLLRKNLRLTGQPRYRLISENIFYAMSKLPLVFACAHLTTELLFTRQVAAVADVAESQIITFRTQSSMRAMAEHLLANAPPRFILIGLSLGGYAAFEVLRHASERVAGLVLMDTRADADDPVRTANRLRAIEIVANGGIDALIPTLPALWMHPRSAANPEMVSTLTTMARDIGDSGQHNQQRAMMARGDSYDTLRAVRVPTLILCGREDIPTPLSEHEAMHKAVAGSTLEIIENCGHLSTIEQPEAVNRALRNWLLTTTFPL